MNEKRIDRINGERNQLELIYRNNKKMVEENEREVEES